MEATEGGREPEASLESKVGASTGANSSTPSKERILCEQRLRGPQGSDPRDSVGPPCSISLYALGHRAAVWRGNIQHSTRRGGRPLIHVGGDGEMLRLWMVKGQKGQQ